MKAQYTFNYVCVKNSNFYNKVHVINYNMQVTLPQEEASWGEA